jgi:AcrR family transcriptional regulator
MELGARSRPYRQVARAKRQRRTREALLEAAEREFFDGHWERASLESMAANAGVTKQTLLRHFGSKEGLFEQAMARGYSQVSAQRLSAPRDDIGGAVENLLDHYEEWGERSLSIAAAGGGTGLLAAVGREARQFHYDWVQHAFGVWLDGLRGRHRAQRRAALIALCDVHTWWLLSHDLGLGRAEVRATLIGAIEALLEEKR